MYSAKNKYIYQANYYINIFREIGKENYFNRFKLEIKNGNKVLVLDPESPAFQNVKLKAKEFKEKNFKDKIVLGSVLNEGPLTEDFLKAIKIVLNEYEDVVYIAFVPSFFNDTEIEDYQNIAKNLEIFNKFYIIKQNDPHFGYFVIDIYLNPFEYSINGLNIFRKLTNSENYIYLNDQLPNLKNLTKYHDELLEIIQYYKAKRKYKKVSFTKEDFWNFALIKDHNELFLSYDKIVKEKNKELLLEILKRFKNIKVIVPNKDFKKLNVDDKFKGRIIIEDDIYERAYKSDFFMLFEGKQRIFEFVRDYTTARLFMNEFKIKEPLWKIGMENYKNNIKGKTFKINFGKLLKREPQDSIELWWELLCDCFDSYEEYKIFIYISTLENKLVLDRLTYEANNPKLLARLKIGQRLHLIKIENSKNAY